MKKRVDIQTLPPLPLVWKSAGPKQASKLTTKMVNEAMKLLKND